MISVAKPPLCRRGNPLELDPSNLWCLAARLKQTPAGGGYRLGIFCASLDTVLSVGFHRPPVCDEATVDSPGDVYTPVAGYFCGWPPGKKGPGRLGAGVVVWYFFFSCVFWLGKALYGRAAPGARSAVGCFGAAATLGRGWIYWETGSMGFNYQRLEGCGDSEKKSVVLISRACLIRRLLLFRHLPPCSRNARDIF